MGGAKVRWLRGRALANHPWMFIRRFAGCTAAAIPPGGPFVSLVGAAARGSQGLRRPRASSLSARLPDIVASLAASGEPATSARLAAGS